MSAITNPSETRFCLPKHPAIVRSARSALVARWFGIATVESHRDAKRTQLAKQTQFDPRAILPLPGEIVLITGPSGAGKSSLLRELCKRTQSKRTRSERIPSKRTQFSWIDLSAVTLPSNRSIVDCLNVEGGDSEPTVQRILAKLGRVGLGEAWTYLRTPAQLSEGQRWRLKLAIALDRACPDRSNEPSCNANEPSSIELAVRENAPSVVQNEPSLHVSKMCENEPSSLRESNKVFRPILIADEFAAVLDRVTACVISRTLRRALDAARKTNPVGATAAIVATSHDDLIEALQPDRIVRCDFESARIEERIRQTE